MVNKTHQRRKEKGLCIKCGKNDAFRGKTTCLQCLMDERERFGDFREKHKEQLRSYARERARKLRSQGICVTCGKRSAVEGRPRCERCQIRQRRSQRRRYEKSDKEPRWLRTEEGRCWICGAPATHGKVCVRCYLNCCGNIAKAGEVRQQKKIERRERQLRRLKAVSTDESN